MIIPHDTLQRDTLNALIEEFVSRHGAVHGHRDLPAGEMVATVLKQLKEGTIVIVFDEESESSTVMTREEAVARGNSAS